MEIKQDAKVYEIGYHLVPTLAEDTLSAEADKIKALITAQKGDIISEALPELKTLAYPISKTVKAIKSNYSKAYFGWVKFTLTPDAVEKVKITLDDSDVIARYLVVSTVKESTLMADKEKRPARPEPADEKEKEEAIETAIDELVNK